MKTTMKFFFMMLMPALLSAGCTKQGPLSNDVMFSDLSLLYQQRQIDSLPSEPLSIAEVNSLMQMREEEKLARDVYKTLFAKWGSNVFNRISSSEQNHMDAVLMLIKKYQLTDPVKSDDIGVFTSVVMQRLYDQLVEKGSKSLSEAFVVGATIEDLDLFDLQNLTGLVDNQDIILVYSNLSRGSRNHLRAFNRNIVSMGVVYTPQYISQTTFNEIINGEMEMGR